MAGVTRAEVCQPGSPALPGERPDVEGWIGRVAARPRQRLHHDGVAAPGLLAGEVADKVAGGALWIIIALRVGAGDDLQSHVVLLQAMAWTVNE